MSAEKELIKRVKQHHAFDEWQGANTLPENLFIWQFFLQGNELATWDIDSVQHIAAPNLPPLIQSVWRRPASGGGATLVLDTYECASRLSAHEFIVRLLAQFQSPFIGRRPEVLAGDVAFGPIGERVSSADSVLLFARANLVNLLRKGSPAPVTVTDLAGHFDGLLVEKPVISQTGTRSSSRGAGSSAASAKGPAEKAIEVSLGDAVAFDIGMPEPPAGPSTRFASAGRASGMDYTPSGRLYKCFSPNGEVSVENGQLVYRPSVPGPQTLSVFGIDPTGDIAQREKRFIAK